MAKDIHAQKFAPSTQHKLWLYGAYLADALPVFLKTKMVSDINLFDFFAGPGINVDGELCSPAIAIEVIKKTLSSIPLEGKTIHLFFNENAKEKYEKLIEYSQKTKLECPYLDIQVRNEDFTVLFPSCKPIMSMPGSANIIFIDQYGIKYVTKDVFQFLASQKFTDFMFFLASGSANRFKEDEKAIWSYLPPLSVEEKQAMNNKNVHRILATSYIRWLPSNCECYLGNFSFQKQSNVYGLVFGSGHPTGLYRFLDNAWELAASYGGQADFDIDDDGIDEKQPELFEEYSKPTKLIQFKKELANKLQSHSFRTNRDIFIFSLLFGVMPTHVRQTLAELMKEKKLPSQNIPISLASLKKQILIKY